MKSLCIKTNSSILLEYLLNELNSLNLESVCFSTNQFKHYKNVIIHYTGDNNNLFLDKICSILSFLVIDELESDFLNRILLQNYFYFDINERNQILDVYFDITTNDFSTIFKGFTNFRIQSYFKILDDILGEAVNNFIIEKEYLEFISLLRLYINSQPSGCEVVHIIYSNSDSILIDENKKLINMSEDVFKSKYLSDITFSSNDYTLNALLTLIPKRIYIHLINSYIDEFIHTLQAVFENRVTICTDCNICRLYKTSKKTRDPFTI